MGPTDLHPVRRKSCHGLLSPLERYRPRPCFNTRTLGPMANTITTRLPTATGRTVNIVGWINFVRTSVDNHFTRQYIPEDNSEHGLILFQIDPLETLILHEAQIKHHIHCLINSKL
jgi:hypothetical protein